MRLALRVAVAPPALLRSLRPLGQPLGHFSVFCCQTHYFRSSSLALPGSALLGALRLALRVAVVPPALLRGLRPLGQPLGHFSVFCCQTHHFCSSQRRREDITPNFICDMTGRYKIVAKSLIRLLSSCPTPPSRLSKTVCHLRLSHAPFSSPAENNRMPRNADTPYYPKMPAIPVAI